MTAFTARQRAELRDAAARSRLEARLESRRLAELESRRVAEKIVTPPPPKPEPAQDDVLKLPEAQEVIQRIGANVDPDYPGRAEYVALVAAVCVRAKLRPTNPYAKATL